MLNMTSPKVKKNITIVNLLTIGVEKYSFIAEIEASGDTTSDYDDLRRLQTMIMELNQTSSANIAGNPPPSRSYCTICHKELCNKYFMRIHMLKVHGISIESSTGLGGVPCDICNKELCSKYFLKVHRQNTHGVVD